MRRRLKLLIGLAHGDVRISDELHVLRRLKHTLPFGHETNELIGRRRLLR